MLSTNEQAWSQNPVEIFEKHFVKNFITNAINPNLGGGVILPSLFVSLINQKQ